MTRPLILLTNDDGIHSPGLAASALALSPLGDLLIVAPREQQSGMGRSMPGFHDGRLFETPICADGQTWPGYAANASPAQAVQHALLELADRKPALVVSGINYGENVGTGITISGTIGAALEAAVHGIRAMAVSLEVDVARQISMDAGVDFSVAGHFTRYFAERWLQAAHLTDVDVLKVEVPAHATPETRWCVTRLERRLYYRPTLPERRYLEDEGRIGYEVSPEELDESSDAGALRAGLVAVTPLSLDMTSRIAQQELYRVLEEHGSRNQSAS